MAGRSAGKVDFTRGNRRARCRLYPRSGRRGRFRFLPEELLNAVATDTNYGAVDRGVAEAGLYRARGRPRAAYSLASAGVAAASTRCGFTRATGREMDANRQSWRADRTRAGADPLCSGV